MSLLLAGLLLMVLMDYKRAGVDCPVCCGVVEAAMAGLMDGGGERKPRYQRAERRQIQLLTRSPDQLLPPEHTARLVWGFVERLDLSAYYADIQAVEGGVGRSPVDPAILLALWLQATIDGVGSARRLADLCTQHIAYEWLCGGVGVNHHLLSDFRTAHPARLEALMVNILGTLLDQELITLQTVAQDGLRVRAAAGNASFRRQPKLAAHLQAARAQVEALKQQADEDAGAVDRRAQAARERAARERAERVAAALEQVEQLAAKKEQRQPGDGATARCSTTDPEARRMKMADGGTRPAYNVQLSTTGDTRLIVGWDVTNTGSDGGLLTPMHDRLQQHYKQRPQTQLADGGFSTIADIEQLATHGTLVYTPVKEEEQKRKKGQDPFAPRRGDSPAIAEWRQRMGTTAAQEIYRQRAGIAELPNAVFRNRGLQQFLVRGLEKVKAVTQWHVLAYNFSRMQSLGWLTSPTG